MQEVVIIDGVRTPIGRHAGALSDVRPDDLAALVIREIVTRTGIDPNEVEEVYFGCANQAGEDNRNVARMGALLAKLPHSVGGVTMNRLCASGLNAVNQAARAIAAGEGEVYIAGGVESMTRAPYSLPKNSRAFGPSGNVTAYDTTLGWRYPNPKMEALFPLEAMGETAENIYQMSCDGGIAGGVITREEQDAFALESQRRALEAINAGRFREEIVPVVFPQRKGDPVVFDTDDYGKDLSNQFQKFFKENGGTIVGTPAGYEKKTTDFKSIISAIKEAKPDVIYQAGFYAEATPFLQQLRAEADLKAIPYIGGDGIKNDELISGAKGAAEGAYLALPGTTGSQFETYKKKYADLFKGNADTATFGAEAYDAATALIKAIEKVAVEKDGKLEIDLKKVNEEVKKSDFEGASGKITFGNNGNRSGGVVRFFKVEGGKYVQLEAGKK